MISAVDISTPIMYKELAYVAAKGRLKTELISMLMGGNNLHRDMESTYASKGANMVVKNVLR